MLKHIRTYLLISTFVAICGFSDSLYAQLEFAKPQALTREKAAKNSIKSYLIPKDHPLQGVLKEIFKDPRMFRSAESFSRAGFKIKNGHKELMVGWHPLAPSYLFKKFPDHRSQKSQLHNFVTRIRGAEIVREQIKKRNFKHLIVPQKWLYALPKHFAGKDGGKSYVLIVENMDICDEKENIKRYYNMDIEILTELTTILHDIGGCDALLRNQPFTHSGKIAFVDTEHVGQKEEKFLNDVVPFLNEQLQAYAIALWEKLEGEKRERAHR